MTQHREAFQSDTMFVQCLSDTAASKMKLMTRQMGELMIIGDLIVTMIEDCRAVADTRRLLICADWILHAEHEKQGQTLRASH